MCLNEEDNFITQHQSRKNEKNINYWRKIAKKTEFKRREAFKV